MPAPRVLFVKLSSLGDVVHHLPAVTDLVEHLPDAQVSWAVEAPYADLVRLHPGVREAIPVPLRRLRARPWNPAAWRALARSRGAIRALHPDYVVDTQGLIKSAAVGRWAGAPMFGFDRRSARERLAARFYDVKLAIARGQHAVQRNRRLVAEVFGYAVSGAPRYGLLAPEAPPAWLAAPRYVTLLHAASRPSKRWADANWVALGRRFAEHGYAVVLPGGNAAERAMAARLAAAIPGAIAAPAMTLVEAAALLANSAGVVGVDTGLTHLAAAFGVPTIGIYGATSPALTGLHAGDNAVNLGAPGAPPAVEAVAALAGVGASGA